MADGEVASRRLLDAALLSPRGLDRAGHLRTDDAWLAAAQADPGSRVVWVHAGGVGVVVSDAAGVGVLGRPALLLTSPGAVPDGVPLSFLGLDDDGVATFAAHITDPNALPAAETSLLATDSDAPVTSWATMREIGHDLEALEVALVAQATALDNWRSRGTHCARCGGGLVVTQAGWAMRCAACEVDVFPRTDPAVIVLVRDADDRALLGRQSVWPVGRMSTLAGFVEAGESAESALRREVAEEVGVRIADGDDAIRYLGSQPWPFPGSLMLGFHAWAATTQIAVDGAEIEEARWFTREQMRTALADGSLRLPPSVSISRRLIEHWLDEPAPGGAATSSD